MARYSRQISSIGRSDSERGLVGALAPRVLAAFDAVALEVGELEVGELDAVDFETVRAATGVTASVIASTSIVTATSTCCALRAPDAGSPGRTPPTRARLVIGCFAAGCVDAGDAIGDAPVDAPVEDFVEDFVDTFVEALVDGLLAALVEPDACDVLADCVLPAFNVGVPADLTIGLPTGLEPWAEVATPFPPLDLRAAGTMDGVPDGAIDFDPNCDTDCDTDFDACLDIRSAP